VAAEPGDPAGEGADARRDLEQKFLRILGRQLLEVLDRHPRHGEAPARGHERQAAAARQQGLDLGGAGGVVEPQQDAPAAPGTGWTTRPRQQLRLCQDRGHGLT
jgi:hypothetical protein